MANIFREAKDLLVQKDSGTQLSDDEMELIALAIRPLDFFPEDLTLAEGLGKLTKLVEQ